MYDVLSRIWSLDCLQEREDKKGREKTEVDFVITENRCNFCWNHLDSFYGSGCPFTCRDVLFLSLMACNSRTNHDLIKSIIVFRTFKLYLYATCLSKLCNCQQFSINLLQLLKENDTCWKQVAREPFKDAFPRFVLGQRSLVSRLGWLARRLASAWRTCTTSKFLCFVLMSNNK